VLHPAELEQAGLSPCELVPTTKMLLELCVTILYGYVLVRIYFGSLRHQRTVKILLLERLPDKREA